MKQAWIDIIARSSLWLAVMLLILYLRTPRDTRLFQVRSGLPLVGGLAMITIGVILYGWAARSIARAVPRAGAAPPTLLTIGPYRHVRHPIYLAAGIVAAGVSTLHTPWRPSDLMMAGFVALLVHVLVVWIEEPATRKRLGPSYDLYCAHVPRWAPRISRAPFDRLQDETTVQHAAAPDGRGN